MSSTSVAPWLSTERLSLQLFDHSDEHYACLLSAVNSPTARQTMGDIGIHDSKAFDAMNKSARIRTLDAKGSKVHLDLDLYYLLRLGGKDGPCVGGISAMQRSLQSPPDLGWCMLEDHQGKGFATEAAKELLRYLVEDLMLDRLMCWPGEGNLASRRVATKLGFVQVNSDRKVEDEKGDAATVYVLPGMEVDDKMRPSLWGESG